MDRECTVQISKEVELAKDTAMTDSLRLVLVHECEDHQNEKACTRLYGVSQKLEEKRIKALDVQDRILTACLKRKL